MESALRYPNPDQNSERYRQGSSRWSGHTERCQNRIRQWFPADIDCLENQCKKLPKDKVIRVHGTMDEVKCVCCKASTESDKFCEDVRKQIKDISGACEDAPATSSPIACASCHCVAVRDGTVLVSPLILQPDSNSFFWTANYSTCSHHSGALYVRL